MGLCQSFKLSSVGVSSQTFWHVRDFKKSCTSLKWYIKAVWTLDTISDTMLLYLSKSVWIPKHPSTNPKFWTKTTHCNAMLIVWHFSILNMKTSSFPSIGRVWAGWQYEYVNTSKAIRNRGLHKLQETSFLLLLLSNWTPAGRRVPQNHVFDWLIFSFNRLRGYPIAPPGKFWIFNYFFFFTVVWFLWEYLWCGLWVLLVL